MTGLQAREEDTVQEGRTPSLKALPVDGLAQVDMVQLEAIAQQFFGYPSLRPDQRAALEVILANPRSLITLPTGGGKSLLYGLLARASPGLTVVVSPLTALKREQAHLFRATGLCAAHLSFDQDRDEREGIWKSLDSRELKLLFVSPERFVSASFQRRLREASACGHPLSSLFVDEAHCMATWGYGFRPEYRQIGDVLRAMPASRVVALTATAGKRTRAVIAGILGGVTGELISRPLRSNIDVQVARVRSEAEREIWLERSFREAKEGRKIIVYVQRRADAEKYAARFRKTPIRTVCYHAGLGGTARHEIEAYIRASKAPMVIFATQAYGMGINLPEVDHVIVCGFPSGIEELIQMIGRSGRAGGAAQGTLLWNGADPVRRMHALRRAHPLTGSLRTLLFHWKKSLRAKVPESSIALFSKAELDAFLHMEQGLSSNPARLSAGRSLSAGELWDAQSFSHVLRLANVVEELEAGSPVLVLAARAKSLLLSERERFAGTDSQRGRVLLALCERFGEMTDDERPGGGECPLFLVQSLYDLQTQTRLGVSQLEKVCEALTASVEGLELRIVSSFAFGNQEGPFYVAAPEALDVSETLLAYEELRAERMTGFQVLDGFARATHCRLQAAFAHFDGKRHGLCGQCDFCLRKGANAERPSEKRGRKPGKGNRPEVLA